MNFNFVYYDENGTEVAFDGNFDVTLFDSNNTTINSFAVTGNNTVTIDDSNISATGKYYLSIGDENKGGYKIFTFDVKSFDLIAYVVDSSETQKFMYDATDDLNLIVFAILNDNMITLSGVTYTIDNNSNSISSITKKK